MTEAALFATLLDSACEPYRNAGRFAYYFARGKLRADPIYRSILELGLLLGRARVLDLGCGQGLLAAWLQAAERCYERGGWPPAWPPAPRALSTRGIELMAREVARARCALGSASQVSQADIRNAAFGTVDAVVILDVLHYLSPPASATSRRCRRRLALSLRSMERRVDAAAARALLCCPALPKHCRMADLVERVWFRQRSQTDESRNFVCQRTVDRSRHMIRRNLTRTTFAIVIVIDPRTLDRA